MKVLKYLFMSIILLIINGCGNGNDKNNIEASGNIEATNVVVSAKVGGQIEKLNFIEGDKIQKNDTLIIIDSESLNIQLQQAHAALELAESQLQLVRNGARKEDVGQAESALKQAEINFEQAKREKKRTDKLYEAKTISQKQFEDVIAKYDLAQQQLNSTLENYSKVKNLARPEEIKQAQARVDQALANENLVRKNIRDSYVLSPITGFVVKKYFEAGETVSPMASLLKISDLSLVKLVIYISEEELGKVKLGQKADIKSDSFSSKIYEGKVVYISPEAEFTPKNIQTKDERTKLVFAVKIEISNPDFELKPGMPADAIVYL